MKDTTRPYPRAILKNLKDFQRDTVEYVFRRLYTDRDATNRFLIADEVGLGKTLVARGLIAKAIDHLWERVKRIDIIYICSNADIARQNINRLNITGKADFTFASRITLLPITLRALNANRVNFVSFTPGTSFDMGKSLGVMKERALLYWMLIDIWNLPRGRTGPINIFQGYAGGASFQNLLREFRRTDYKKVDRELVDKFAKALASSEHQHHWRERFDELNDRFRRSRTSVPERDREARNRYVRQLRELLSETCLAALEPDLIILDEFQRFKHLLDDDQDNEVSQLAHQLFNYADHQGEARVVLLSATPYKMYTLAHDKDHGDDHYQDFLRTIRFLQPDRADEFERLIAAYRRSLFNIGQGSTEAIRQIKTQVEQHLRRCMVRTERLSATDDRNGMLCEIRGANAQLKSTDLQSFVHSQRIARLLNQPDIMEYWKSSPYLFNYMDDYQLKTELRHALQQPALAHDIAAELMQCPTMLLSYEDIVTYRKIDPNNARLRGLMTDMLETGAWKLLWTPPALPYYQLDGPFAEAALANFTKRLVFSSWKLAPKVIATMLSYEAERRMMLLQDSAAENTPEARERRRGLLMLNRTEERLTGMPVLALMYPSITLAYECDSLHVMKLRRGNIPTIAEIRKRLNRVIKRLLAPILPSRKTKGAEDQSWYWAAPILLDHHHFPQATRNWFARSDLAQIWTGESEGFVSDGEDRSGWRLHVGEARKLLNQTKTLGRPPADLVEVLTSLAMGAPGIIALRALCHIAEGVSGTEPQTAIRESVAIRTNAAQIGWAFRSLFNLPEAMALLRGLSFSDLPADAPYWQRVLAYAIAGGLQSVLDEYLHILRESQGLIDEPVEAISKEVSAALCQALSLRTATLGVDRLKLQPEMNPPVQIEMLRMRSHFASRFGEDKRDDGRGENRKELVRLAFNSPFWPFVLATTSVGQEGLDFHQYCHAVVHWNLPSNPVDLEQREGRIHRYKGHAVRKNLATAYGLHSIANREGDPWNNLFEIGRRKRAAAEGDLVPYWVFPGSSAIERHVPILPLSRDNDRLENLRRSLTVYRIVFGQNRQEDLVQYLLAQVTVEELDVLMRELCINLEPQSRVHSRKNNARHVSAGRWES